MSSEASLSKKILLALFVPCFTALTFSQSSFTAPPENLVAPLDDVFNEQIGTLVSCGGLTIGSFSGFVNWGDTSASHADLAAPLYQGHLFASHIFTSPNTYLVSVTTSESCVNIAGSVGSMGPDGDPGPSRVTVIAVSGGVASAVNLRVR